MQRFASAAARGGAGWGGVQQTYEAPDRRKRFGWPTSLGTQEVLKSRVEKV